jgi:hypothetical protein
MAWRCRFLTARPSQDARVTARVPPTHWLISTQVDETKLLHLVAVVGADARNRTDRFRQVHLREHKVAGPSLVRWRLRGAASTAGFDFRRFGDVDVVLAPSVLAYWQELTAAYPRAKLTLILGEPHAPVWKSICASVERRGTDTATPSSRRRVDGVEDDAMISPQARASNKRRVATTTREVFFPKR